MKILGISGGRKVRDGDFHNDMQILWQRSAQEEWYYKREAEVFL
jgi:hypothetical protein